MAEGDWWYDLNTKQAVQDDRAGKVAGRRGPYHSREEAERALDKVAERNAAYDNDPRWNDDCHRGPAKPVVTGRWPPSSFRGFPRKLPGQGADDVRLVVDP